jgi:pimeloyl-ACP methyl ester carboxylesterase
VPAVFVHGVPETAAVWDPLLERLRRDDAVALSLPGFGTELPAGFEPTKEGDVDWLVGELEALGEPVDLVGHDWGGGLTGWIATVRPDLLRTWASDTLYVFHQRYRWHQWAVRWQTPAVGEQDIEATLAADPDQRAAVYAHWGVPQEQARTFASWFDARMGDAILALYRSATDLHEAWAPRFAPRAPGLAILPTAEQFTDPELIADVAARHEVPVERFEGLGHWWMLQDPDRAVGALERFWSSPG